MSNSTKGIAMTENEQALAAALLAILREVDADQPPAFSGDSYLPAHLIEQARAALEKAGAK